MVVLNLAATFRAVTGSLAAAVLFLISSPALANSSANADIAAPLRAAKAAGQSATGGEDEQFRKLFNSWQSFEESGVPALAAIAEAQGQAGLTAMSHGARVEVSIPSRVPLTTLTMTSGFGMRTHPILGGRRAHTGIDLAAPVGTPVYATADGLVSRASWFGGYGLYVAIEHGGQIETRYGHMSRLNVAEGQRVQKGDIIGFVGTTGRSTGPHLHYEVRVSGEAVNPLPYMHGELLADASGGADLGRGGPQ